MRVIAGSARGRPLRVPKGGASRPTSDLMRGVVFDLLTALGAAWDSVLDLYAGSGALGIEALSRGARRAVFVEQDRAACRTIRENLTRLGFQEQAEVRCQPVERALRTLAGPYSIILLDPPYADPTLAATLAQVGRSGLVGPATLVVLEHSKPRPVTAVPGLVLVKQRCHGDSCVSIFRRGE
ncbi:MAG: 16S rRNA (guanine(966)-N(2))-methyltransferase RsmD [Chloroflexi bacterium]|nr:16S rRNA (guanine(966)-N(2))-methyltransferase RsmD [Chloroflexota bacterium]GIW10628.1 MAG: methyltransferase [Dehalococcoidia bacterium]